MKKLSLLALIVLAVAGCASKYSILTKYHMRCDEMNPTADAFVGYVDCMNSLVNADDKVSQGNGTIKIMATANQYKVQVLEKKMTSKAAKQAFQNKYQKFTFASNVQPTPDDVVPAPAPVK
ncbi:hypothetical protein [Limnobaculum parvum]|uniref:Lipoprotein n=1 Tax=Limnobaculum parvum TaxID=2172103 RepID=A0A2Y9TX87_9GAMM|nr:hypothetical protein [Limnobaculum parvum]AWH88358.1 hypothetical protein HYN51_07190 [Limnobaculum parvum]